MSTPDIVGGSPNNPFGDAAAATRAMIDAANATPDVAPNTAPAQTTPQVDTTTPPVGDPGTPDTGTPAPTPLAWDDIDLTVLPEDARKVVQDGYLRHSDYTRKTQELAEQRKQFESLGDLETVQAAVEFARSLEDPRNLMQLKADIEEHLTSLGATPAAAQAASAQLTDTPNTPGLDPVIQGELAELRQFREEYRQTKAEQEHARQEAELVSGLQEKLQTQEDAIRKDYPVYTQDDINEIYKLIPAHDYDLFAAQAHFEDVRKYLTQSLIGNKGNHPDAANPVRSDTLVHQPEDMNSMENAKKATAELFARG